MQPLADVVRHVSKGYRMECPEGCPSEVYELMRAAWQDEPQARPPFGQVLRKLQGLRLEAEAAAGT